MKSVGFFVIFSLFLGLCLATPVSSFAASGQILDYYYDTHYSPDETVRFTATVKNTGVVVDSLYIQVALTNYTTGVEISPYPTSGNSNVCDFFNNMFGVLIGLFISMRWFWLVKN